MRSSTLLASLRRHAASCTNRSRRIRGVCADASMKDRGGPDETAGEALPTEQLGTVSVDGIGRAWALLIFERESSWSMPLPAETAIQIGRAPDAALRLSD